MKVDPISTHERALIIHHLAACGKWQGTKMGAQIALTRYTTVDQRELIQYSVQIRHWAVSGQAKTVFDAIEEVNQAIRRRQVTPPLAGRVADPERTGTPHLVRREA